MKLATKPVKASEEARLLGELKGRQQMSVEIWLYMT